MRVVFKKNVINYILVRNSALGFYYLLRFTKNMIIHTMIQMTPMVSKIWMIPPRVKDKIKPKSHNAKRITPIAKSIYSILFIFI
jgi:hypothetical protein